jgi:serine/threonine protein kinase
LTQGHDNSADFWAFGVLIYELLCGHTPFAGRNQQRTFEKIVHSTKHLTFPTKFDSHAKSLIRRLLHPNPSLRIGCLQNGCQDVKEHAFFISQNLEFHELVNKTFEVTYKPKVDDVKDVELDFDIQEELSLEFDSSYTEYFKGLSNSSFQD